eukprot:3934767-Rhodomonas_salina.2
MQYTLNQYPHSICLRARYAVSGTDIAHCGMVVPGHSIGITATGQAFTWGANNMQQLGYR